MGLGSGFFDSYGPVSSDLATLGIATAYATNHNFRKCTAIPWNLFRAPYHHGEEFFFRKIKCTLLFLWVTVQRRKRLISLPQSALSLPCSLLGLFICLNKWQGCWVPRVVVLGEAQSVSGSCLFFTHRHTQSSSPWPNCLAKCCSKFLTTCNTPPCVCVYTIYICLYNLIYIIVYRSSVSGSELFNCVCQLCSIVVLSV